MLEHESVVVRLSFGKVLLEVPEAIKYLDVAIQLLETRRAELSSSSGSGGSIPSDDVVEKSREQYVPMVPSNPAENPHDYPSIGGRGRWFHNRLPQVQLRDGSKRTIESLEQLKEFLRSHGLTPHPRGDASMLLWQVRNRLLFTVEPVPLGSGI